jgi:hypothetical protein
MRICVRYVPRTNNNLPAPPINDFDFLNTFARDYYKETRAKARYDANVCMSTHTHTHYYYYYKESRAKARYDVNAATFANAHVCEYMYV